MNEAYRNAIANYGASIIGYIGLRDSNGTELTGGTPAYARVAVTWTAAVDGLIRPTADVVFNVPAGTTVASWFAINTTQDTELGGAALTAEAYAGQGEYKLLAASSGIAHTTPV